MVYPVHVSDEKFGESIDLLLVTDENRSHYVYIKNINRFMRKNTENKNKEHFSRYRSQYFSSEKVVEEQKKVCLKINGKQSIKPRSDSTKFKNYFEQLAVPFKIFADFESDLKGVQSNNNDSNTFYAKEYQKEFHLQGCMY